MDVIYNKEAEEAVLGCLLVHREAIADVSTWLDASDFFNERYGQIYEVIQRLTAAGEPVNNLTLFDEFAKSGDYELSVIVTGLQGSSLPFSPSDARAFGRIVKDDALRRAAVKSFADGTAAIHNKGNNIDEVLSKHAAEMMAVKRRGASGSKSVSNEQFAEIIIDTLSQAHRNKDKPKIRFPWPDMDKLTGPLNGGTLVGVIAEPGVGKTVFLENCSEAWLKNGWNVAFYHHELDTAMMGKRYIQRETGISVQDQSNGSLTSAQWDAAMRAADAMTKWPGKLFYEHCPGWTAGQITAHVSRLHELHGLNAVIIDYFNKIAHTDRPGLNAALSREQDIEEIKIALEMHGLVGVMAAQFDKNARKNGGHKSLADAKETSALEDKSNVGIVIRRDRDEDGNRGPDATFNVTKCNAGREGVVNMFFVGSKYLFAPTVSIQLVGQ